MRPDPRADKTGLPGSPARARAGAPHEEAARALAAEDGDLAEPESEALSAEDAAPESLPFDQYQRYRLVADLVERIAGGERLSILDLGGRTGILRGFLPGQAITLVDVEASREARLVLGDGSALPFRDGAFDLVVACDTLEHVPPARRDALCREACRVARRYVILAGPYRTQRVVEAEELLRGFLREKLGLEHRYLDEHRDQGLPDLAATERALHASGARTASVGHGNVERWVALLCLSMYMDEDRHLRAVARRMYRFYNRALYASDHAEPVYRHALVAALGGRELPDFDGLFDAPVALPASLEPFTDLVAELAAFDREHDVYHAERARMQAVIDSLIYDLQGHRRAKAVLETDLAGHKVSLLEARARLAEHVEALADIEADLAGHQKLVLELEQDLEGHRGLVTEIKRDAASVAAELERIRADVPALEQELGRVNALASNVNDQLVAATAEGERLRAEMRSRWKNLKRALSWKKPQV